MINKYFLKRNYVENTFLSFNKSTILTLLLILISLLISGCNYESIEEKKEMQSDMTDFLQEKYDKEFVVDRPEGTSSTLSSLVTYTATAYPKDNPKIIFKIATDFPEAKIYHDNYLNKLWSYQGEQEILPYLKNIYDKDIAFRLRLTASSDVPKDIDYKKVIENYKDNITIDLFYCIFVDEKIDKEKEVNKTFNVFEKYILTNKVDSYFLTIFYIKSDYKKQMQESFDAIKLGEKIYFDSDKLFDEGKLINKIQIRYFDYDNVNIKKSDFNINLFKY